MTTDVHGTAGRTMSAGEAALRRKIRDLSDAMLRQDNSHVANAGQLISDVLTDELDPQRDGVRL